MKTKLKWSLRILCCFALVLVLFSLDEDDAKTYVEGTLGVKLNQSTLVMAEDSIPYQDNNR